MGNAVEPQEITRLLRAMDSAGLGGVEIAPIYGIQTEPAAEIPFLSETWMARFRHTLHIADSLGMQVDLTLGTGWPFGGPQVDVRHAASQLVVSQIKVSRGARVEGPLLPPDPDIQPNARLLSVLAFGDRTGYSDLSPLLQGNSLDWQATEDDYTLYLVFDGKTGQLVKRAAPGGEGFTVDHYSRSALDRYLVPFAAALDTMKQKPRTIFNDSFEVYDADFSPEFFEEFLKRRGYDLRPQLPKLLDSLPNPESIRVKSDYRETLSDMLLEDFNQPWTAWAHRRGLRTRLQAHGSPGNLIDQYASADIPECETFYSMPYDIPGYRRDPGDFLPGFADPVMLRFAASAAHISGKPLVSSESFTWLREHFRTALSHCKPEAEDLFLSGVNHLFLHGSTYSPERAAWPGWKFYASVNFNPTNTIWTDAPGLFNYLLRCQAFLQRGESDNDVLLYWPVHDVWGQHHNGTRFLQISIHSLEQWLHGTPFYETARFLMDKGFAPDFISDRFLQQARVSAGRILLPGGSYSSLVVPDTGVLPLATLRKLLELRAAGGHVIFRGLPESVPGYRDHETRETELRDLLQRSAALATPTRDLVADLVRAGSRPESLAETGLKFVRRRDGDAFIYFLVNHTAQPIEGFIPLNAKATTAALFDPLSGRAGLGTVRTAADGRMEIRMQLRPGQTLIVSTAEPKDLPDWDYLVPSSGKQTVGGPWSLQFLAGGPELPGRRNLDTLQSWTQLDPAGEAFSGTALYRTELLLPEDGTSAWRLDLGDLRESAKVRVNGRDIGTVWAAPFEWVTDAFKPGNNTLELEVTNLAANRLRAKELRGEPWKIFKEINMVNKDYEPFDATGWEPVPSGLLGPVTLTPLKKNR